MKKYKVLKRILLGFMDPQDQYEAFFLPSHVSHLETENSTIYVITTSGNRLESITTANIIEYWLKDGTIEEFDEGQI